jgi:hypothetical protein
MASELRAAWVQIARAAADRRHILTHGPEISFGDELLRASALSRARGQLARAIRRGLDVAGEDEVLDALLTADRELDRPDALALIDNARRQPALLERTLKQLGRTRVDEDESPQRGERP